MRRLFHLYIALTLSGPALATADAQTPAPPPDLNVTGKPDDTATMDPDTSVGSINNSSSGLRIRVPDGFGGVTTLPDGLNASKRAPEPDSSNSNADRKQ